MFEKILVPLDGSEHAAHALEKAIKIAKKFDGKLTLLHAYNEQLVPMPKEFAVPENAPKMIDLPHDAGVAILEEAKAKANTGGAQVETLLATGNAAETIVEVSKNGEFDLIVIGARGLGPIKEVLLGSVSHAVATHAHCPVLVVK